MIISGNKSTLKKSTFAFHQSWLWPIGFLLLWRIHKKSHLSHTVWWQRLQSLLYQNTKHISTFVLCKILQCNWDWMENNESAWHHQFQTCLWNNQWIGNNCKIQTIVECQMRKTLGNPIFLLEYTKNASVNNQPSPEFVGWTFASALDCKKLWWQWLQDSGHWFEHLWNQYIWDSRCNLHFDDPLNWLYICQTWK